MAQPIYHLRIFLLGSRPLIWRRILVSGNIRLKKLHAVIQAAMGWTDSHLHEFVFPDRIYSDPEFGVDEYIDYPMEDEGSALLRKVASIPNCVFLYRYDFGDDWRHFVEVEWITDECAQYPGHPLCLEGEFSCPPEDCGGIVAYYEEFLPALVDADDTDHEITAEWAGDFDPERFDLPAINERLSRL